MGQLWWAPGGPGPGPAPMSLDSGICSTLTNKGGLLLTPRFSFLLERGRIWTPLCKASGIRFCRSNSSNAGKPLTSKVDPRQPSHAQHSGRRGLEAGEGGARASAPGTPPPCGRSQSPGGTRRGRPRARVQVRGGPTLALLCSPRKGSCGAGSED